MKSPPHARRVLSTRARLVLLVTAVLIPVVTAASLLLWRFSATERAQYREQALSLSRQISGSVDLELTGLRAALEALATSPALQHGDFATFDRQARAVLGQRGDFIALRDRTGQQFVNTSRPFGTSLPVATDPVIRATDAIVFETGKPAVSDLYVGAVTKLQLVLMAAPVMKDGVPVYSLNIAIDPTRLADLLSRSASPDWTISLVDRNDRIIARSRQHARFIGSLASESLRRNSVGPEATWVGTTLEGVPAVSAHTRSALSGWRVAVGIPSIIIEAPLRRMTWILASAAALVLGLSAALAAWASKDLSGPLHRLSAAADGLGRGEAVPPLSTGLREADEIARALHKAGALVREREAALRASEERVRESQARLRAVFEAAPVGLVITEAPSGRIIEGNKQTERIFRHPIILSSSVEEYGEWVAYHPDGRRVEAHEFPIGRLLQGREERPDIEVRYQRGDGTLAWLRIIGAPVRDDAGQMIGAVAAVLDIDAEKRAAEQLRELNATLEARVEAALAERDRIWRVSRDLLGVATFAGIFETVNPAWERVLGWTQEEICAQPILDIVHDEDREATRRRVLAIIRGGEAHAFQNRCRHKDGTWRWLSWTAVAEDGHLYCVARDVTDERAAHDALRQTEEQLRQSQKMEVVGQLTGGIAHDFNNLLTVVTGHLDMARRRLAKGDDRAVRNVEHAMEGAQRAATLTHRLLAFSRQTPLRPEIVDLNRLITGMSDLIRRSIGETIAVETVLPESLWRAEADPNQIESAILNLCVNARDAMPDGGRLTLETSNVELSDTAPEVLRGESKPGAFVAVTVRDTGTGMPDDVRARAFEPFFTTKPAGKGTGLGLSQVYGFLRQSGGHAVIASQPGTGTAVRLLFPRLRAEAREPAPPGDDDTGEIRRGAGETILVIEDEALVREFTVAALQEVGFVALAAADAEEGLAMLDANPQIRLLLTDIVLPGAMNGRAAALEALRRRPDLKVLYTTGYSRDAFVTDGRPDDDVELLPKPFTIATLSAKLHAVLRG